MKKTKLKVLFISNELIGSGLIHRLIREGHGVKLYIKDPARKKCLTGFVKKTRSWRNELKWVGKKGLIIFDDVGFGQIQDDLRTEGYTVFGGTVEGDKLELDRALGQRILHNHKIKILPSFNFRNIDSAIDFVKENKGKWVVKQNSHVSSLNHVGEQADGSDVIEALHILKKQDVDYAHLQKKVDGIEVGIARYFNGHDWVGPIEINHEYKRMLNGDVGPLTAEMGTVMWHSTDESLKLFECTLRKITPYLQKIGYKGDIDVNCIVTKDQIWPLEFTPRLGSPSTQLQCALYDSSMADFIYAVAKGKRVNLKCKKQFGIVVSIAVPPFPYPPKAGQKPRMTAKDRIISFTRTLSTEDECSVCFEEVSKRKNKRGEEEMFWAGTYGYVAFIATYADTIPKAKKKAMKLVTALNVPHSFHRTDIGDRVHKHDLPMLKKWGWV